MAILPITENVHQLRASNLHSKKSENERHQESLRERTLIELPISSIHYYENNPRRRSNPNYNKIKNSIANDGLNQPLVVSRRPEQKYYFIYKGGNTRLKAVKELFDETGDHRYRFVECFFIPWSGDESDAIIGHLQENEMRKSLSFFDKAHGIKNAIDYLKRESENDTILSIRDCHSKLIEKGYSITLSSLSIMLYAVDMVEPNLSSQFCDAMGRRQVQNLRRLHKAVVSVCSEFDITEEQATRLYHQALANYSEPEWGNKLFRRSLDAGLAKSLDTSMQDVSLRIEGYLNVSVKPLNDSFEKIFPSLEKLDQNLKHEASKSDLADITDELRKYRQKEKGRLHQTQKKPEFKAIRLGNVAPKENPNSNVSGNIVQQVSDKQTPLTERSVLEDDLKNLRIRAYAAASRIAKKHGFLIDPATKRSIVVNTGDWGVGYLITDYPPPIPQTNPSAIATRDALWWLLMEFSDLQWAVECARPYTAKLVSGTDLFHFIKTGDQKTLFSHSKGKMKCTFPHLGLIGFCMRQLDNDSWSNLRDLADAYRNIHKLATNNNVHLFWLSENGEK